MTEPSPKAPPRRTPLFALHEALGARLVTFAGYALPVHYGTGIVKEHLHTREHASLFDVSHMGQVRIAGPEAAQALETVMPIDVIGLPVGRQRYGFLTNEDGGIRDDLMVARLESCFVLVVNAATKSADLAYLRERLPGSCAVEPLDDRALLALQGPAAGRVMRGVAPQAASTAFMDVIRTQLLEADCLVSRSGYTGEDGFEISVPAERADGLARALLADAEIAPAGLGARDSLRLEAGLCLYGHDIDAGTTPIEASLAWAIPRIRRPGGARAGGYPGADVIAHQLEAGAARRRVALLPRSRVPVRGGAALTDAQGKGAGRVTSGGFGPTLGTPVAMGYVETALAMAGTELSASVRGKPIPVRVASLPAVAHRHVKGRS